MPKQLTEDTILGDMLHQWTIQEYDRHIRGTWWHILMITAGILLVVYALVSGNSLFALIVILFAIILFLQSHQEPIAVPFAIAELGIVVGNKWYTYSEFSEFYIIYQPPAVKTLYLETKSALRPLLRIPLQDMNPVDIRMALRAYLSENVEKEEEPISDVFARQWKIH